jgi:trk system potassium uptake protein
VRQRVLDHPTRLVPFAFACAVLLGTLVLMLPISRVGQDSAPFLVALFTATSAICVTGLAVVDTATYWTPFGQAAILVMIQIGGFGIMALATFLGLLISRKMRLRHRLVAQAETKSLDLGDVKAILFTIFLVTLIVEAVIAGWLTIWLHNAHQFALPDALWHGVFHAVSAYNNAGFSTWSANLMDFALDPFVLVPIMVAILLGGIGFPVYYELKKEWNKPKLWSVHARLTIYGSAFLFLAGTILFAITEWTNAGTLGSMGFGGKLLNAAAHSVMVRTAGFNAIDIAQLRPETLFLSNGFMLIGGGSAGTAGGIKVTTFFLLVFAVWAEIRGHRDVTVGRRRIAPEVLRQAFAVVLLAFTVIGIATLAILAITELSLDKVLFEVVSAFATVGLSAGVTPGLPPAAQFILIALMFMGRVGTITIAAALALRPHNVPFRYPEERPIVG